MMASKAECSGFSVWLHRIFQGLVLGLFSSCLFSPPVLAGGLSGGWKVLEAVPLPGPANRFDYLNLDPLLGRLFLAHLGASRLVVFDTGTRSVIADLPGFPHAHGVLVVPLLGRVFVTVSSLSRTEPGQLAAVDEKSLRTLDLIPAGIHPDGLDFDPDNGRVFVSNEWGGSVSAIDGSTGHLAGTIPLGGEVGNTRYDPYSQSIYATVQTRNLLVRIDPESLKVLKLFPLEGGIHPHGLWVDGVRHQAFIACEGNATLLVLDLSTGRITGRYPLGARPDVLAYDGGRKLLYVASESGWVSVFRNRRRGLEKESDAFLGARAHSIAVDPSTHRIYLPLENDHGRPVLEILRWEKTSGRGG